ncbi:hypothetical protein BCR34DRAFT_603533 [Clohesyomyces aquaticus]|uniref:Uncharacterized protein n=1 Tax=Clohesyomyces aquaticus TaxID=1231657 RepID=A0A1Y1ZEQ4_9PLEO|nr:hypothetical protein BCR34DRAFT_603533 [Clohesyomyces aquaticus]
MAPVSTSSHGQAEPLLAPKLRNEQASSPLTPTASGAIKALAILRGAIGVGCLIAPHWSCALFRYPIPASGAVITRLLGAREIVLGELLFTAEDKTSHDGGRREIRRALWANMASDGIDVFSILFGVATGTMGKVPGSLLAGGAIAFLGLGALGMRGLD